MPAAPPTYCAVPSAQKDDFDETFGREIDELLASEESRHGVQEEEEEFESNTRQESFAHQSNFIEQEEQGIEQGIEQEEQDQLLPAAAETTLYNPTTETTYNPLYNPANSVSDVRISFPQEHDGVFSNMAAKPTSLTAGKIYEELEPPSYHETIVDPSPDYFINCIDESGEVLIEGMPMGNFFLYAVSMFLSMTFDILGFFLTTLLAASHAARLGSQAGLGLTLMRYGVLLKDRAGEMMNDPYGDMAYPDPQEEKSRREWSAVFIIVMGVFIFLRALVEFIRLRRMKAMVDSVPLTNRLDFIDFIENAATEKDAPQLLTLGNELEKLLNFYKKPNAQSKKDLESQSKKDRIIYTKQGKELSLKISKDLDVDELQAYDMYWNVQKKKTKSILLNNDRLMSESDTQQLYEEVKSFYYQERIATLDLVSCILRISQDSSHACFEPTRQITSNWMANSTFKTKILESYKEACAATLPSSLEHLSDKAAGWVKQNLKEQKGFLEIQIMLYYSHFPSPDETEKTVIALIAQELGSRQLNRPFFDRQGLEIHQQVEDLSLVLFIEMLNFEVTLDRLKARITQETLFDRPDSILAINNSLWELVENSINHQEVAAPIGAAAIGWACYTQLLVILLTENCPLNYNTLYSQLANSHSDVKSPQLLFQFGYLHGGALDYLIRVLDPMSFIQQDSNEIAYKSIIKGLLNILLCTQSVSTLPDRSKLVSVFSSLYNDSSILCNHYWTLDHSTESGQSLLEATRRSFPVNFSDFITLITSLIADADSADYVCQYLWTMKSFCDFARSSDYEQSFEQVQGLNVWYWKGRSGLVYGSPNFSFAPPEGTVALEVGTNLVLLDIEYSAWHLFLCYLDSFLHLSDFLNPDLHVGSSSTTALILKLFNAILKHADSSTRMDFLAHLGSISGSSTAYGESSAEILPGIVGEIMNRCCNSKAPMLDVITECLQTVQYLLPHYPEIVWKRLRGSSLFPQYAFSSGNVGYFQSSILPLECSTGKYSTTLSFLSLVKCLALESQKLNVNGESKGDLAPSSLLYSSVLFIVRDVFSTYNSWRFVQVHEKFRITLLVLEILDHVMQDTTWYHFELKRKDDDKSLQLSSAQKLLLDTYVLNASNYQLSPLLDVITLGPEGPIAFYKANRKRDALLLEQCMVASLRLLKRFLLVLTQVSGSSGLESALLDRTVTTGDEPVEFIQIIASLIDYQNNADFAQLATENLTLLCTLSKKPGRPSTFFVGYFGAEAFTLVSKFIDLVRVDNQKTFTSASIQTTVYSFITAVVGSQPGLGAMFLSGYEPRSISSASKAGSDQDGKISESSILHPLLGVIRKWKEISQESPSILLSCLILLDTLWQSASEHQATIKLLRSKPELWDSLLEILKEKLETPQKSGYKNCPRWCMMKSAQAYTLRLLSVEVYLLFRNAKAIVSEERKTKIVSCLVEVLVTREVPIGQDELVHHPEYTAELLRLASSLDPPLVVEGYRRITWNDSVDVDRNFGNSFVYDLNLLKRKLNPKADSPSLEVCQDIIDQVQIINYDWSFTDVQIVMLRASCFSLKLLTSGQLNSSSNSHISREGVFHLMKVVLKNLQQHKAQHFIHINYKADLATLMVHLINYWLSLLTSADKDQVRDQVRLIFTGLKDCMMISQFPLGPVGTFSKFDFHGELLSAMHILAVKLSELYIPTAEWQSKIDDTYQGMIAVLCNGLYHVMGGKSLKKTPYEESLLLSLLFELTRRNAGASVSVWLPYFERFQVCPLLLHAFSTWQKFSKNNLCFSPEKVLEFLLSLSSHPSTAKVLISNGVVASLCNNVFSNDLLQGQISGYDGAEVKQIHQIWCLMLCIVSELVPFIKGDSHTLESIVGFVRLYQNQIFFAINSHKGGSLTIRSLWEVERILGLYCRIAESLELRRLRLSVTQSESLIEIPILQEFQDQMLGLLTLYVFLFKNPNELGHRIQAVSRQERNDSEIPATSQRAKSSVGNAFNNSLFKAQLDSKLLSISEHIVNFLRIYTQSTLVLAGQYDNDPNIRPLFTISLSSFQELGATFGTLFDLLRHLISKLKVEYEQGASQPPGPKVSTLVGSCESILTLISAQLKLVDPEEVEALSEVTNEYLLSINELNVLFLDAMKTWRNCQFLIDAKHFISLLLPSKEQS